jgi:RNA 2',3'-cyclic 3'-phosphodiesterase
MPRLFVAIDTPGVVREGIADICHGVEGARWVSLSQFHITLEFIGEVDSGTCDDAMVALEQVEAAPFTLGIRGVGTFPPRRPARVLWAGLTPSPELEQLQADIRGALLEAGIEGEGRAFHPHITLARFKQPASPYATGPFAAAHNLLRSELFEVSEFHLYSSDLSRDGAVHTIEQTYPLDDPAEE